MQAKSSPQVKTPGKKNRKSLANASPKKENGDSTPVSKKNAEGKFPLTPFVKAPAATPNKKTANTPKPAKTPKQNTPKATPVVSPAKTANTPGGKQKRKQSLAAEASPAKQQKPAENAGGKQKKKQSSPAKQQKPAEKGKQKPVANGGGAPSPKQMKLEKFPGTTMLEKFKNPPGKANKTLERLQKRKDRRNGIKNAFKTLKEGGQLTPAFANSIQSSLLKIEKLSTTKTLSKSAKRKLNTYRKLQRLIEANGGSKLVKREAAAPKQKQQGKKAGKQLKLTLKVEKEEEEDESDAEEESDDEDTEDESGDEEEEEEVVSKPVAPKQKKQGKKAQWGKNKKQ